MATECIAQVTFDVQGLRQPVVARFDQPYASSDGGAVLLKVLDDRLGVTERLAASLIDDRQPGKVHQSRRRAGGGLRDLLWAGRHGESPQGAASGAGAELVRIPHLPRHKLRPI